MNITVQQLRYLLVIAEEGSFTAAARKLHVAQPSLSAAARAVEDDLGFPLFSRGRDGVRPTKEGLEFLGYARQAVASFDALETRFGAAPTARTRFAVSAQHYTFAANAFAELAQSIAQDAYELVYNETQTHQVNEDVRNRFSELGVIYLNATNEAALRKTLNDNRLAFHELFVASPCAFLRRGHPLAGRRRLASDDLALYPQLCFVQGTYESPYYAEEPEAIPSEKVIRVSDRAAIVNLMVGLDAYTISSGIYPEYLQGDDIVAVPLADAAPMRIGYIAPRRSQLSALGDAYVEALQAYAPRDEV